MHLKFGLFICLFDCFFFSIAYEELFTWRYPEVDIETYKFLMSLHWQTSISQNKAIFLSFNSVVFSNGLVIFT